MLLPPSPSSLADIRAFLARHGSATPAWSSARVGVDGLMSLLVTHADDATFWQELRALATRLDDRRVHPGLLRGAEVLGGQDIDALLEALRASLPETTNERARTWARAGASAQALAAFLVLGLAMGCSDKADESGTEGDADVDTDTDTDTDTDIDCAEAKAEGLTGAEADVFCDLVELVKDAAIGDSTEQTLLDCLDQFNAKEREALLSKFQAMSEKDLAQYLEGMSTEEPCWTGGGTH